MTYAFKHIGIAGNQDTTDLAAFLKSRKIQIVEPLDKSCELIIVVGGDGSMLHAAHNLAHCNTPVIGINRGRLGFLADIKPNELETKLDAVLQGKYREEKRFFLDAKILHTDDSLIAQDYALNEVVLAPGDVTHMVEFEIYIDNQFVCSQRADGLITATPTGSTAYSMSGGGSILHPNLNALLLFPMFPHTLTSRPIIINADHEIKLVVASRSKISPRISCDGREHIPVSPSDRVIIRKKKECLTLIHPLDYDYFETLRTKLHWGTKIS